MARSRRILVVVATLTSLIGLTPVTAQAQVETATITGTVWADENGDGIRQATEPGIPDNLVNSWFDNDLGMAFLSGATTTDANGRYELIVEVGPGWAARLPTEVTRQQLTIQDQGSDDSVDSDVDPESGTSAFTVLEAGDTLVVDIGILVSPSMCGQSVGELSAEICRLYVAMFGRVPNSIDLDLGKTDRSAGASLLEVAERFANREEFEVGPIATEGDVQAIELGYMNAFGRAPDPEGQQFWLDQFSAGVSRVEFIVALTESPESIAFNDTVEPSPPVSRPIARLYRAALGRGPDAAGLAFWVERIEAGSPLVEIADFFVSSTEFGETSGSLDDAAFVEFLYVQVLGRPSEGAGASFWRGLLAEGRSRGDVLLLFSESVEFRVLTDTLP